MRVTVSWFRLVPKPERMMARKGIRFSIFQCVESSSDYGHGGGKRVCEYDHTRDAVFFAVSLPDRGKDLMVEVFAFFLAVGAVLGSWSGQSSAVEVAGPIEGNERDIEELAVGKSGV